MIDITITLLLFNIWQNTINYKRNYTNTKLTTMNDRWLMEYKNNDVSPIKYYWHTTELYGILKKARKETKQKNTLGMEKEFKKNIVTLVGV